MSKIGRLDQITAVFPSLVTAELNQIDLGLIGKGKANRDRLTERKTGGKIEIDRQIDRQIEGERERWIDRVG